ncbi:bifunctional 3-(3-hydroxy-phenyl)propionate/3-hydroxycinnamic acid hydroxylase [Cognatishimia sp. F0-27]|uniref:bifunctional 3-(3-hydroxy-phenyl)propionate/3-hydroxycinnamic acid hydroxylase MhpA n=1 Tax=Cognatishimia sp. F0-27 TaxID=2816855 RepID=UPI001D0CC9F6|nr:bifunctional 3-(3-hydroxy-phenyl)propionate/3-hydroxycinnamic acid hydroxylase [Cognatishimia sp. F0-27]MCC1494322.1 bifunctional 3-(3-hydroxy-phenyl)propionate/3-hydroxycinnamic acid hydroxylase [Cognatishimia sp. F0-27]
MTTSHPASSSDVVIVGAGPVGLLLAILLGKGGKSVTIVEKWPDIYDRPRAVTMDAEVARILATLGIDCDTDPAFENHKELYYWKNADLEDLQIVDWESLAPCGWHVTYWFNQPELEARLITMAKTIPSVTLLRGWTAIGLTQDDDGATLTIEDTATQSLVRSLRGQFVVGADGANSFVRDQLDLKVIDKGYFFDWLILDMVPHGDYRTSPAQWQLCDPKRPTTIVPGGPGRRRWEFMVLPSEDPVAIAQPESAWRLLEPWGLSPENATLERSAVYRFQARWAEHWVSGRCMIAGDAAHLMPPFAGEGMCAGLRDAVALAWRLSAILDHTLPVDLLKSYESERISHARHYIQFSQDLGEIICIVDPEEAAKRDARMMAELADRDHKPITGDLVKLGPGIWCAETPSAGELSPQGLVLHNGRTDRFDQAVGQGWFVLALNHPDGTVLSPAQAAMFSRLGGRVVSVGPEGSGCDVTTLDTTYADWATETGASYAILRPDFYVAATAPDTTALAGCLSRLFEALGLAALPD